MSDAPILESGSGARQLWQRYRIHADRLEFDTMFGRWTIPFATIEGVDVAEAQLAALLRLRFDLKNFPFGVKLDTADFAEHVVLDRNEGVIKRILFTPDDPAGFKRVLEEALEAWRRGKALR